MLIDVILIHVSQLVAASPFLFYRCLILFKNAFVNR